jgi:beta-lactamase class A
MKTTEILRHRRKPKLLNFIIPVSLCLCGYLVFAVAETPTDLVSKIPERIKEYGAKSVGIYFESSDEKTFTYNENQVYHAASTMKVPVMMEVFRQVESGELKLDQPVKIENKFSSIMDGSPYSLTKEDDSDTEIYGLIGQTLPLQKLLERMINRSSNLAANTIIKLVSAKNVMVLMNEIGAKDMTVLRGVEDDKAYEAGKNNTTSARALALCMKAIMDPKLFHEESRKNMLQILESQHFREGIPTGIERLEKGLRIANKDGWITEINHDSAIILEKDGRYSVMVILTEGVKEDKDGEKLVAALAADLWQALKF